MPELAYLNGAYGPIEAAKVSIQDRGFQFGDGIYEVLFVYGGRVFLLEPHMGRLRRSAEAIRLPYDFDAEPLEPVIREGLARSGLRDAMIYIQLTRGPAPRAHLIPKDIKPTVVMTFRHRPEVPQALRDKGASVLTLPDVRWANCCIKSIMLLPNTLAKTEAHERGYDDAILVASSGEVREATSANVFVVRERTLAFPPRSQAVLHGVTQAFLLDCAAEAGIAAEERPLDVEALRRADEVFLSSTAVEVLGVTAIDDRPVADGRVGPITRRLADIYFQRSRAR